MPHSAKSISIIDMTETRTISEQLSKSYEQLASAKIYWFLLKKKKRVFRLLELFLTVFVLMSTFKNNNSLRTIEAQIVQKLKNNEARPKFSAGSYKKKRVYFM